MRKKKFLNFCMIFFLGNVISLLKTPVQANREWEVEVFGRRSVFIYPKKGAYEQHKGISQLYSDRHAALPKAPMVLRFYQDTRLITVAREADILFHVPPSRFLSLPKIIQDELNTDGVDPHSTKMFIAGQHIEDVCGPRQVLGFYPQFGTDPSAPSAGSYHQFRNVKLMVGSSDSGLIKFEAGHDEPGLAIDTVTESGRVLKSIVSNKASIVHPPCGCGLNNPTCTHSVNVSPTPITLSGLDRNKGESFWSYVSYKENDTPTAIVTLHLLWKQDREVDQHWEIRQELWGNRRQWKNFGLIPSGESREKSTEDLINIFSGIKENRHFKGHGQHFQHLLTFLKPPAVREAQHPRKEPGPSVTRRRSAPTLSKERIQVPARKRKPEVSRGRFRPPVKAKAQKASPKTKPHPAAQKVKMSQRAPLKKETPSATKRKVLKTPLKKRPAPATRRKGIRKPLLQKRPRHSHMRKRRR